MGSSPSSEHMSQDDAKSLQSLVQVGPIAGLNRNNKYMKSIEII